MINPGTRQAIPMPRKYLIEMACDWRSFSRKCGRKVKEANLNLTDQIILHPDTKKELEIIMMDKSKSSLKKKNFISR